LRDELNERVLGKLDEQDRIDLRRILAALDD
jgi:hypothetical protein